MPPAAVLATCAVVFAAVSVDVTHHGPLDRADLRVARWNAVHMPGWVEAPARVLTYAGWGPVLAVFAVALAAWLVRAGRVRDAVVLLAAPAASGTATSLLKLAFHRPRPDVGSAIHLPGTYAYPSGHTSGAFCVLLLLALLAAEPRGERARRFALGAALALATVVAVTRVVLNAHYVSDVVAGACVGLAAVSLALLVRA
jgi:undecaprenyl-diphosphatase